MGLMDAVLGGVASGGLSLIGNILGAQQQNSAQAAQAQQAEAFSERMSDTQYQRGMADMKAAGLNPMLAYMNGGASSPSGVQAPVQNVLGPAIDSALNSGFDAARTGGQLKQIGSQVGLNSTAASENRANIDAINAGIDLTREKVNTEKTQQLLNTSNAKNISFGFPAKSITSKFDATPTGNWVNTFQHIMDKLNPLHGVLSSAGGRD